MVEDRSWVVSSNFSAGFGAPLRGVLIAVGAILVYEVVKSNVSVVGSVLPDGDRYRPTRVHMLPDEMAIAILHSSDDDIGIPGSFIRKEAIPNASPWELETGNYRMTAYGHGRFGRNTAFEVSKYTDDSYPLTLSSQYLWDVEKVAYNPLFVRHRNGFDVLVVGEHGIQRLSGDTGESLWRISQDEMRKWGPGVQEVPVRHKHNDDAWEQYEAPFRVLLDDQDLDGDGNTDLVLCARVPSLVCRSLWCHRETDLVFRLWGREIGSRFGTSPQADANLA